MGNHEVANKLVDAGCYVNLWHDTDWVTLPSGEEIPAYLSVRKLISQTAERTTIETALKETYIQEFSDADLVVGLATAGIPWAASLAKDQELPLAYVRSSTKDYGIGQLVEGAPRPGSRALIIDDTLFTGESLQRAIDALKKEKNILTIGVLVIAALTPEPLTLPCNDDVRVIALTSYKEICAAAISAGHITPLEAAAMIDYYETGRTDKIHSINESMKPRRQSLLGWSLAMIGLVGSSMLMPRGGNYKAVRQNLMNQGKANAKRPMPSEQKRLRRRKRKKK